MAKTGYLDIADLRGGQNGADAPLSLSPDQVVAAVNVDWHQGSLARKRDGLAAVSMAPTALTTPHALVRHTPTQDVKEAELWAVDAAYAIGRCSGEGSVWSTIVPTDAISGNARDVCGASLNGKLFLAYKSVANRLHVWDGSVLRRGGIAAPVAAPTVANTGSGSYTATVRYYRQRFTVQAGGVTVRRSEPSATVTFTPSGSGTGAVVTMAALAAGEVATHWELYGSSDNGNFWLLATTVVGTTTYTDSAAPSSYSAGDVDYAVGDFLPFPSVKYLCSDENRLIGAGSHENSVYASRLFFSPVMGSGVGDEERSPDSNEWMLHLDLDNQDGGGITGIGGPINNCPYVFKYSQVYKLVRTSVETKPYRPVTISKTIGCLRHQTICEAVDEAGLPCLYFLSYDGPRRISGSDGMQWLGSDVRDIWATVNLEAANVGHAIYYQDLHQVWFWVATGTSQTPNTLLVFDTRLGRPGVGGVTRGWSVYTGVIAGALASTVSASSTRGVGISLATKPHISLASPALARCGVGTADAGTTYRGYVKTKPYLVGGLGRKCGVMDGTLLAVAASGVNIRVSVDRDFGLEVRNFDVSLTPEATESRVIRQVEDLSMADATALQFEIGDATATASAWTLEGLTVLPRVEGDR